MFLLIVAVSGTISCVIVINYEGGVHRESLSNKGASFANYVAELSKDPILYKNTIGLDNIVKSVNIDPDVVYAFVYDSNNNLLTSFFASVDLSNDSVRNVLNGLPKNSSLADSIAAIRNVKDIKEVLKPVLIDSDKIGTVVIGLSEARINIVIRNSLYCVLLGNLVGCFAAFLLVLVVQKTFINPIISLADLMKLVSSNRDYSVRAKVLSKDELGDLSVGFNHMLEQIQSRDSDLEKHRKSLENLVTQRTLELFQLGERQRIILESAGEGIIGLNDVGYHSFVNKAACDLLGWSREDLLGKSSHLMWHHTKIDGSPYLQDDSKILGVLRSGNGVFIDDEVFWRRDKISFPVEYVVSPIKEDGKITGLVIIFRDITLRKKAEETLKQAKETAELALAIKEEFTSMVSHELRTPLSAIKSSIDILDTELPGGLTNDQKVFIKRVKSNIDRLARLINDVLDFTKLESGGMVLELLPLRPEAIVQEVVEIQGPVVKSKGLTIETKFGENLPALKADKDRLIQVLDNLISNALKFTKEGGIVISVLSENKKRVVFCVHDTGIGIKDNEVPKLFQKFQQVGGPSQHIGGTGLGLSICKQIIAKHGGQIWVESQFGRGSAFYFTIPTGEYNEPRI